MNRFLVNFEILFKSILKPKQMQDLIEERNQSKDDEKRRNHSYEYNFDSVNEFFLKKFPDTKIDEYEKEIIQLNEVVDSFFNKLKNKKYPSSEKPYPIDYSINSDSRKFLYILCRILKPENVIETGVAYGLSSMYILKALEKNQFGTLHSIDSVFRPWQSEKMIGAIIPHDLRDRWDLVIGKTSDKLEEIFNQIQDVEIFIHDSLHTYKNMIFEFECAKNNLKNKGIIISDDVVENDAFFDFTNKKDLENYLIKVEDNSGLGISIKN
ncbi:MAG: class I SAM-dependent methyltransferase [Candidatus Nitrosopelagicus sp.]|nr:class I SAM-dependent methyltransferase [Candidatus Nitrosopelagicus sp.]